MRARVPSAALAAGLVLAGALPAASADVAGLLSRIRKAHTSSPSVSLTFVQSYAPAGFPDTAPETGKLVLQAPDWLRFEYDGAEGKLFTFDGRAGRQYVAADKQMVVKELTADERSRLPLLFLQEPQLLLDRFDVAASGEPGGLVELTLTPRSGEEPRKVSVTATPEGDVKRLVILDAAGNRTTFTFTGKEAGKRRPPSDFALVPPKGTRIVGG